MTRSSFLSKLLSTKKAPCKEKKVQTYFVSSKTCPECRMTYTMSESDIKLHRKHHYNFIHGIVFPLKGNFYKILNQNSKSVIVMIKEEIIVLKDKLQEILKIVDETLGSSLDSSTDFKVHSIFKSRNFYICLVLEF
jgi:hypothetical protein